MSYTHQTIKNNPLKVDKQKGFMKNSTTHAYNVWFVTEIEDKDFLNFAQKRIDDGSYTIFFFLRDGEVLDKDMQGKMQYGVNLLRKHYPDVEFSITFCSANRYYTSDEFKNLLQIEEFIQTNYNPEYNLRFAEGDRIYSKQEILTANAKISEVVNTIRRENLSPIEAVLYVHRLLTERIHVEDDDSDKNRDIYSVLNQRNMICTGFANLFTAIFTELNDPRIKVKTETLNMIGKATGSEFQHAINCVYIKDDKYKKEGYFHLDCDCNAINEVGHADGLNAFLVPSNDVEYMYKETTISCGIYTETLQGNLQNQTIPFKKNSGEVYGVFNKLKGKSHFRARVLNHTKEALNTDLGLKVKSKLEKEKTYDTEEKLYLAVINYIVDNTEPIDLDTIESAYVVITKKFIKPEGVSAEEYARNVIQQAVDRAGTFYDVEKCDNAFAKEYIKQHTILP